MIGADILASMTTIEERQRIVGRLVRDLITDTGETFVEAARHWPMSLPTLNRLMRTGDVGLRFYATAEKNLGLPRRLLENIVSGNLAAIRDAPGLDEHIRTHILRELGDAPPGQTRAPRKRGTGG